VKYGLSDENILEIQGVFSRYPQVEKVILYGSRARGNFRNGSDMDLTLVGSMDLTLLGQIIDEIDDLLLPYSFDISLYQKINDKELLQQITEQGVVFYQQGN
jgi:predicted nucleotidyltransferase